MESNSYSKGLTIGEPMITSPSSKTFKLTIKDNPYSKDDILYVGSATVLTKPKKVWYKVLAQWITFGFYSAPWEYKIKMNGKKEG